MSFIKCIWKLKDQTCDFSDKSEQSLLHSVHFEIKQLDLIDLKWDIYTLFLIWNKVAMIYDLLANM